MQCKYEDNQASDKAPPPYAPSPEGECAQCGSPCHGPKPSLTMGAKTYKLHLWFIPRAGGKFDDTRADWMADLEITTEDLPRLMRNGFHWSPANVLREEGSIQFDNVDLTLAKGGWRMTRRYELTDSAYDPQWTASLSVFARQIKVLTRFRVSDLSQDMVYCAWAKNKREEYSYVYNARAPEDSYNTIYDDMPMSGWWPWPNPKEASNMVAEAGSWESGETE